MTERARGEGGLLWPLRSMRLAPPAAVAAFMWSGGFTIRGCVAKRAVLVYAGALVSCPAGVPHVTMAGDAVSMVLAEEAAVQGQEQLAWNWCMCLH